MKPPRNHYGLVGALGRLSLLLELSVRVGAAVEIVETVPDDEVEIEREPTSALPNPLSLNEGLLSILRLSIDR